MQGYLKDDKTIMKAVSALNRGDHREAQACFQEAGNQIRNPKEKQELWNAAERSRNIINSD